MMKVWDEVGNFPSVSDTLCSRRGEPCSMGGGGEGGGGERGRQGPGPPSPLPGPAAVLTTVCALHSNTIT